MGLGSYEVSDNLAQYDSNTKPETIFDAYYRLTGRKLDRYSFIPITTKDKNGVVNGLVIFCDQTASSASIHIHLPNLLHKSIIKKALNYAFTDMKVIRLFAEIRADNKIMLNIAEKLGFSYVTRIPDRYDIGVDQIIMVASENDVAKWIK